jgi:hypothetical protein
VSVPQYIDGDVIYHGSWAEDMARRELKRLCRRFIELDAAILVEQEIKAVRLERSLRSLGFDVPEGTLRPLLPAPLPDPFAARPNLGEGCRARRAVGAVLGMC